MPSCARWTGCDAGPSPAFRRAAKTVSEIARWVPSTGRDTMSTASDATPAAPRTSLRGAGSGRSGVELESWASSALMSSTVPGTRGLQVLPGVRRGVDLLALRCALAGDERADVDDPLALLAGDAGPVVGVGRVRQVLGLGELVHHGVEQVLDAQTRLLGLQVGLDRRLLGPAHDVLDHRAGVEVLEVQDLLVPVGVGDLGERVIVGPGVEAREDPLDHAVEACLAVAAELGQVLLVDREAL